MPCTAWLNATPTGLGRLWDRMYWLQLSAPQINCSLNKMDVACPALDTLNCTLPAE